MYILYGYSIDVFTFATFTQVNITCPACCALSFQKRLQFVPPPHCENPKGRLQHIHLANFDFWVISELKLMIS